MRVNSNDKVLVNYYKQLKRRDQLKREIETLESSRKQLELYSNSRYERNILNRLDIK